MKNIDLEYLCRVIGNLAGIPIRIYHQQQQVYFYSVVDFPADPVLPYLNNVFTITDQIGYFTTPYFNYYGIVRSGEYSIVIGPSRQTQMSDRDMRELAFACDVPSAHTEEFISAMKSLVQMPLGSIIQILCTLNYVLNGEKRSLEDVTIYDFEQTNLEKTIENERFDKSYEAPAEYESREIHNTLALEQALMQMISKGDVGTLCEWLSHAPSVRGGVIANDALRQLKNTFIVTATLASRAAIKGGMSAEDALSLSDEYIRKCELLSSGEQIINLQYHMVLEYTRRVERIRLGKTPSKLLMQVTNYVQHNLSKPVNVCELAKSMYISRTHLAAKFKQETGMTLTDFILIEKIEEAKRLLRYSDKSLSLIADYLGFSSQSHFTRAFKKYSGKTPREYRNLNI
ncbi:MAG: helix-turn-helix domain-containing protein [Clostridia bacterium]|nr:helix-turn-helix domain-containing protein [Clostridia bacterium]